jgi:hypothetical protein
MITQQTFAQWQQKPQDAIPNQSAITPADEAFFAETLVECRVRLQMALETAKSYSRLPDRATALGDAVTGCEEAIAVIQDPQKYIE